MDSVESSDSEYCRFFGLKRSNVMKNFQFWKIWAKVVYSYEIEKFRLFPVKVTHGLIQANGYKSFNGIRGFL